MHNFQHITRINNRLTPLSDGIPEPIRHDKLFFLVCFHGLGKILARNADFDFTARDFLKSLGWTKENIEKAFQSLCQHLSNPRSIEEKVVQDANYVKTLGVFWIAKAFTTGGAKGQSLEETINFFENQFHDKVVFQTPAGKLWKRKKKTYTKEFLKRLKAEL